MTHHSRRTHARYSAPPKLTAVNSEAGVDQPDTGLRVALIVPIKDFKRSKLRLSQHLTTHQRVALTKQMAETVLKASGPSHRFVVCDSAEVKAWTQQLGVSVLFTPNLGLNGAIAHAVSSVKSSGADIAIISHGDLPRATSFDAVIQAAKTPSTLALVGDRHQQGTNVLAHRLDIPEMKYLYGPGSLRRHRRCARILGITPSLIRASDLELDIDTVDDLKLALPALGADLRASLTKTRSDP